jgi:hypothetical protein
MVNFFPIHAMKRQRGSKDIAPLILNLSIRWRQVVNLIPWLLYPQEKNTVLIEKEVGWATQPFRAFRR